MIVPKDFEEKFSLVKTLVKDVSAFFFALKDLDINSDYNAKSLLEQLDKPFSIFICGEFNSGKSSLLNKLAEKEIAKTGVVPTTSEINAIQSAGLVFVDSPGTNSILKEHQEVTEKYLKKTDVILFVTSVERPLADSEVGFLKEIKNKWSRKLMVAINKVDQLAQKEIDEIKSFVEKGLIEIFSEKIMLFLVSAKTGFGVEVLVEKIKEVFNTEQQLSVKINSPLDSTKVFLKEISERLSKKENSITTELEVYEKVIRRFESRISESELFMEVYTERVKNLFKDLSFNLKELIDEKFRFFSVLKARIFGSKQHIKGRIHEIIEDVRLEEKINSIVEEAAKTLTDYQEKIFNESKEDLNIASTLGDNRIEIPDFKLGKLDVQKTALELKESAMTGINKFLTLGGAAAATGIGASVASAAAFEITSLVLMLTLALFSLRALPNEREKAKKKLDETFEELSNSFSEELKLAMTEELNSGLGKVKNQVNEKVTKLYALRDSIFSMKDKASALISKCDSLKV